MSTPRFHVDTIPASGRLLLPDEEAAHARLSRRLGVAAEVMIFDGRGQQGRARIVRSDRGGVELELTSVERCERYLPELGIALALPKGPRQELLVEKCTELGVARIQPLLTQRSVPHASEHKLGRLRRTAIEAAKQSGQCWVPELDPPLEMSRVLEQRLEYDGLVAAVPGGVPFEPRAWPWRRILAFVGPEGGWAPDELELLRAAGAARVSLGPNILRVETAAIALAVMVHALQHEVPEDANP